MTRPTPAAGGTLAGVLSAAFLLAGALLALGPRPASAQTLNALSAAETAAGW